MSSTSSVTRARRGAFTLVELLVVIGIIALLISILLPSLNRAREAARVIKCGSNLHAIGQALAIYEQDNKGYMPYGYWDGKYNTVGDATGNPLLTNNTLGGSNWGLVLLNTLNGKSGSQWTSVATSGGFNSRNVQLLQCPSVPMDVAVKPGGATAGVVNHYTANPRLMPRMDAGYAPFASDIVDNGTKAWNYVKAARITRSAEIAAVMEGSLIADATTGAWDAQYGQPVCFPIDGYGIRSNPWLYYNDTPTIKMAYPIYFGAAGDTTVNTDSAAWGNQIRFRHTKDTIMNALMLDGHVQTFRFNKAALSTDLLKSNVYVSR